MSSCSNTCGLLTASLTCVGIVSPGLSGQIFACLGSVLTHGTGGTASFFTTTHREEETHLNSKPSGGTESSAYPVLFPNLLH